MDGGAVRQEVICEDDGSTPTIVLRQTQDVDPILDQNARLRQHTQVGTPKMDAKLAARTPEMLIYNTWATEFQLRHGVHPMRPDLRHLPTERRSAEVTAIKREWRRFKNRKLNDPDYAYLRIHPGRLPT